MYERVNTLGITILDAIMKLGRASAPKIEILLIMIETV
jgi:hypothetical protein